MKVNQAVWQRGKEEGKGRLLKAEANGKVETNAEGTDEGTDESNGEGTDEGNGDGNGE